MVGLLSGHMKALRKPEKLVAGDTIATISLSWGGAATFPHRYQIGKERLENKCGLKVKEARHALRDADWLYRNPQARAEDLMECFADPEVKGIFAIIGGDDSIRLMPFIDYEVIAKNPKIFLGYSDSTVTHFMCMRAGVRSFYGPAVMTAFAENVEMHEYTVQSLGRTLYTHEPIGSIPQNFQGWTNEHLEWSNPDNAHIRRRLNLPDPWRFIAGQEKVQGRLIGGCVELLQLLLGTELWPSIDEFDDCILFFEISEDGMTQMQTQAFLRNLASQGILKRLKGMLFSKPAGVPEHTFYEYDGTIGKVLSEYGRADMPVITNMDFGHTDPMLTLPIGALAEIDPQAQTFSILESGVS